MYLSEIASNPKELVIILMLIFSTIANFKFIIEWYELGVENKELKDEKWDYNLIKISLESKIRLLEISNFDLKNKLSQSEVKTTLKDIKKRIKNLS